MKRLFGAALAAMLLAGAPALHAQRQPTPSAATTSAARLDRVATPVTQPALQPAPVAADSVARARGRRGVLYMAGGAAAIAAGAVVKGNTGGVIAAAGTVSLFYGMYQWIVRNDTPVSTRR